MTEIIFKDNSIQTGHRIKIPKAVIDTLELNEGQKIKIKFDVDKRILIIEEDDIKEKTKKKIKRGKRK
tara:strand:- start:5643 stop:5846 length:204 start_codon:yes stop_codon:yes gene_type:complete